MTSANAEASATTLGLTAEDKRTSSAQWTMSASQAMGAEEEAASSAVRAADDEMWGSEDAGGGAAPALDQGGLPPPTP